MEWYSFFHRKASRRHLPTRECGAVQMVQLQTTPGDYRKAGGVLFPHLIEVAAVGRPQQLRIVLHTIEVNRPLSDARFEISDAGE